MGTEKRPAPPETPKPVDPGQPDAETFGGGSGTPPPPPPPPPPSDGNT